MTELPLTGERTLPGVPHENYWFRRHEVVYRWAREFCRDARVLDAGCGEGYGAAGLAPVSERVVGLDYDVLTVDHAASTYAGIGVVRGNLVQLPFATAAFDVVVSLQTIEHLWDQRAFLAECARVVRPGGLVALSTPNTLTFPPGNPCHPHEVDAAELRALVAESLQIVDLFGLRHSPALRDWEVAYGDIVTAQLAAPPDAWPDQLRARVESVGVDDFELHEDALNATLDLVVLARRSAAGAVPGRR